jgi:hypothetical protein
MQMTANHLTCLRLDCRWAPDENREHYALYTGCQLPLCSTNLYNPPLLQPNYVVTIYIYCYFVLVTIELSCEM